MLHSSLFMMGGIEMAGIEMAGATAASPGRLGCAFFDTLPARHLVGDDHGIELELTDDLRGPGGALHGGLVTMLVDVAGASCLAAASGRLVATATTSIEYLAAGRVGPIRATGQALRVSASRGVAEIRVVDRGKDDRLMAVALVSVSFLSGDAFVAKTE
jgi:uncharacterized protein (TIGR00369 family)